MTEYSAVRDGGAGLIDHSRRGRLLVSGSEAVMFLNGLITNDMKTLAANTCNKSAKDAVSAYYAHAEPVTVGSTGQRSFATDSRGTIYFLNTGVLIPAGMAGASVLQ